jgi:hypothetical protein
MTVKRKSLSKSSKSKKGKSKSPSNDETCFVIMPFTSWFDNYYDTIYVPAIKTAGLNPRRADDLYRPSSIVNDIWGLTEQAKIILADLSGKNPNVFYELGLAHALTKPAILVTETMEDVPFDLRSLRVIVYEKNEPNWGDILRRKIEIAIKEVLSSPLDAVLPTFLKVKDSTSKATVSKEEKELILLRQDMDLIKREMHIKGTSSVPFPDADSFYDKAKEIVLVSIKKGFSPSWASHELQKMGINENTAQAIVKQVLRGLKTTDNTLATQTDEIVDTT